MLPIQLEGGIPISAFIKDIEKTRFGFIAIGFEDCILGTNFYPNQTVYKIEFSPNGTCYDRMKSSVSKLGETLNFTSRSIAQLLLGNPGSIEELKNEIQPISENYSLEHTPGLGCLNDSQKVAIMEALKRTVSLIQGPPGTGKTMTTAALVYHLINMNPERKKKIIVTAPSNYAVDILCERIQDTGVKVLRVYSRARETKLVHAKIKSNVLHLKARLEQKDCIAMGSDIKELTRKVERKLILDADVICCTCSVAADMRFEEVYFPVAIIDEASQATIPLSLIPIMKGSSKVVIVGDHKQLGPIVLSPDARALGFELSLFQRLVNQGLGFNTLLTQYRMHPSISAFPNKQFYNGELSDGITESHRKSKIYDSTFKWPNTEHPIVFIDMKSDEKSGPSGSSFQNELEANKVVRSAVQLAKTSVLEPDSIEKPLIGILTFYEAQRACLVNQLKEISATGLKNIEIDNVDAFQGREKDFIVLSCVRSNNRGNIGFVDDAKRLNVALTRAKYGLVIFGDANCLSSGSSLWYNLIQSLRERGCVIKSYPQENNIFIK